MKTIFCASLSALALLLCACGGGSSAAATNPPAMVTGVAMPTSVSAVTAN